MPAMILKMSFGEGADERAVVVDERRAVTPVPALTLARYFGTTDQFWLDLQSTFDLKQVAGEVGGKIEREVKAAAAGGLSAVNRAWSPYSDFWRGS